MPVHRMLGETVLGGTILGQFIEYLDDLVWGPWMLALLLGSGCYLMLRLDMLPLKNLKFALRCAFGLDTGQKERDGGTDTRKRFSVGRLSGDGGGRISAEDGKTDRAYAGTSSGKNRMTLL